MKPPVAAQRPHEVVSPHGTRQDPYYWLRDDARMDPDVLAYIEAENAYTEAILAPAKSLEDTLFAEIRARVKEDDASVPVFDRGWWYSVRFETGQQYPIYERARDGVTEVLLDGNALAQGHAFYKIASYAVSPDGTLVAWAEDTVGRNQFVLRIKRIATGELLPDTATNISGALAWASDSKTLFYGGKDPVTLRADRVSRVVLGGAHELVHREDDASFYVGVGDTKSRRYITIGMRSTTQSEFLLIDADHPAFAPRVFIPRTPDHIHGVDHLGDRFVVRTNDAAKNFRIVSVPWETAADRATWKELVPHRADTLVESFALFDRFLALSVRSGGLRKVQVLPDGAAPFFIDAQDPAYTV